MTFKDWINNPSGKGSSVMTNKSLYKDMYTKKLDLIVLRENNGFKYTLFKSKDDTKYYIYIKIPSEVIKRFYYDIVIEFSTKNPAIKVSNDLEKYDIRVFSNSPDFIFTHVYAYNKAGLFLSDLVEKIPKQAIKTPAKERNPKNEIGYIKSIYFTYLIMRNRNLLNKSAYSNAAMYQPKNLLMLIMHAADKIKLRQDAEVRIRAEEHRKKRLENKNQRKDQENLIKTSTKSNNIVYTKKASNTKHSKSIKKI